MDVGDRVAVEVMIPCGHCRACLRGRYQACTGHGKGMFAYSYVPLSHPPGLWGAYADYLYLHPLSRGTHHLHFTGSVPGFTLDINYTIHVKGGGKDRDDADDGDHTFMIAKGQAR